MTTRGLNPDKDVAVVGMGLVTPVGADGPETWRRLLRGESGVRQITAFDAAGLGVRVAGEVRDSSPYRSAFLARHTRTRRESFAFRALDEALRVAALSPDALDQAPLGIFTGCERENTNSFEVFADYESARDPLGAANRHRLELYARQPDAIGRTVLERARNARLFFNYTMACAASAVAVHEAVRWIRRGVISRALVIGADTPINVGALQGFEALGALSTNNAAPEKACRPFDQGRDGFVLAEGAGVLLLESAQQAAARERDPVGWILGVGMTNNQAHITKTPPGGEQAARAVRRALADADLAPGSIGYINAHGTSTDVGDAGEAAAILSIFDPAPPTSSTKSMTGHMVAASGVVELIVTLLAVREGWLPPTINHERPDPDCPLDCVSNRARSAAISYALSNSFGFGGTNVSLVIGKA